jgi:hypothetical protein
MTNADVGRIDIALTLTGCDHKQERWYDIAEKAFGLQWMQSTAGIPNKYAHTV